MKPALFLASLSMLAVCGLSSSPDVRAFDRIDNAGPVPATKNPVITFQGADSLGVAGEKLFSKTAPDLLSLFEEFQSYRNQSADAPLQHPPFRPSNKFLSVVGDTVMVDAVASGNARELAETLRRLGAEKIVVFGRIVSCRLSISAIPKLNNLSSLHYVRPAYTSMKPGLFNLQPKMK